MAIMPAEREHFKYTLRDRATDFWRTIHPQKTPPVLVNVPVTEDTVNEQGFHQGDVVGYPTYEQGEQVVRPARIELDARKSGDVFTNLDLGYLHLGGNLGNLQRVLPGMEQEISLAVDEERRRSKERRKNEY